MTRTAARARWLGWLLGPCIVIALALVGPVASGADTRTEFLVGRLRADDFKVRTNAALALGQTGDESAIGPLCAALADPKDVVRQAAAAALERLNRPAGAACLRDRLRTEGTAGVKAQITRALAALESGSGSSAAPGAGDPPKHVANARFYVALSPVSNQTGRPDGEISNLVGAAVRSKLDELGGYQVAPDRESPEAARGAMTKRKLKGYYLSIRVERFEYEGGNLRVRVKIAVFTYPGKDLRGEVPAGLTQTGVRPGDKSAEDNLMQMAAARAVELFAQNFP
jgi:hypothetical protein